MDAAQKLLKNSAILTAAALLVATVGFAQPTLNVSNQAPSFNSINQSDNTNVTSSGDQITFNVDVAYNDNAGPWLKVVTDKNTTPAFITFSLNRAPSTEGVHSATVTFTPTLPLGVTAKSITVTYTSGNTGGGGGSTILTASPSPVYLSAGANSITAPATVMISTSGSSNVTIAGVSTTETTGTGVTWLSAQNANANVVPGIPGSITITGNSSGLAAGTYTGSVTVTPSTGGALTIPVNFTVGSGGGSGNWNVNPSSVSWNYSTGGGFPSQAVSVTPTFGATYYNVSTTSSNGWLLASINGSDGNAFNQVALGTILTLKVSSQVNALAQGVYPGTANLSDSTGNQFTINITLTVNGGNSTGLNITPNPLTFSAALSSAEQSQLVTITSNTGGAVTVTGVGTTPSWLRATGPNPANVVANQQSTFTVYANPAGLTAATYSSSIAVTVGGQSGTLTVTLVVGSGSGGGGTGSTAVAPTSLNFTYQFGSPAFAIAQQKLVITGPAGPWSASISSGTPWLKMSPTSGSALPNPAASGENPIVYIDPTGLATGSYSGTIGITTAGGAQNVTVSLSVVSGAIILPTPGSLVFSAQSGQPAPPGQSVFFSGSDNSLNPLSIAATSNNSWIAVTYNPTSVSVQVDPTGLSTGVYSGSFSVTQTGAGNSPTQIPVVLVVNGGGNGNGTGTLTFSPGSLSFNTTNGTTSPSSSTLSVTSASSTSFVGTISYSPNNAGNWLTVSPLSSVTPANLAVSANGSGLATGIYSATISFNVNGVIQTVGVTLTVNTSGGGSTGNVTVSPTSLTFSAQQGVNPPAQSFSVTSASGIAGVPFTVQVTSGTNWLSTSANANMVTPVSSITVTATSAGLLPGTYNGNIQVAPNGGTTVNIPVTLTVAAQATVSATPTTLTFDYRAGDTPPAAKQLTVSGGGATLSYSVTPTSTGNWLVVSPVTGTTPGTVNVTINPSGLSTGTYNGTILVAGAGGASGSTTVSVTLNVTAPLPTITKVTNAASYVSGAISPGEMITLFAGDPTHPIGPATPAGLAVDSNGKVATTLGGVQVLINGLACPMIYVSATQVSAVVPYELKLFTSATVFIKFLGQSSNGVAVSVATTVPGVFTANSSGTGPGAILNSNNSTNSPSNPATRGDTVVVYLTGEGETSPAGVTGKVTTVAAPPQPLTPAPLLPVSVTVGGQPANWSFAGEAPGIVSGVMQLNVIIPTNISATDQTLVVTIGGNQSQPGVTVSVK